MIDVILLIVWVVAIVVCVPLMFRGTLLATNTANGQWWPLWLYQQFAWVLPAPILLATMGVAAFPTTLLVVRDSQTFQISAWTLYAATFFFITVALCIRVLPKCWAQFHDDEISQQSISRFAWIAVGMGIATMAAGVAFLGYHHAILDAAIAGEGLSKSRIANKYATNLPSQAQFVMEVAAWVGAVQAGYSFAWQRRWTATAYFIAATALAGAGGGKAPVITQILLAGIGYLVASRKPLNVRLMTMSFLVGAPLFIYFIYYVVALQIPDLTLVKFVGYLFDRLFMAQMAGTYDGLALGQLHGAFYWHMIPFASLFEQYIPYDKSLMMYVEGYDFASVGVKNSFFISEAFGIGGYGLVLVSPFIVGVSFAAGIGLTYGALRMMFGYSVARMYFLPLSLQLMSVTGGFSSFPLFKGYILLFLVLGTIWIPWCLMSLLPRRVIYRTQIA